MAKEFQRKYMHPTRRKLVDMIKTGEYDKNTQIGWVGDTNSYKKREIGEKWEDENNLYEQKEGYVLKTGKNHEALQEIRKYIESKSNCKNSDCKTIKKSKKDKKFIEMNGYCMNCTIDYEHKIKTEGLWEYYQNYKIYTRMIVYGKHKLEQLKQSLLELKPYYEFVNEDGTIEKWDLPKSLDETKKEIQELIDSGQKEIEEIEKNRLQSFEKLKEKNYEHYV